jgi:hypothetical protein
MFSNESKSTSTKYEMPMKLRSDNFPGWIYHLRLKAMSINLWDILLSQSIYLLKNEPMNRHLSEAEIKAMQETSLEVVNDPEFPPEPPVGLEKYKYDKEKYEKYLKKKDRWTNCLALVGLNLSELHETTFQESATAGDAIDRLYQCWSAEGEFQLANLEADLNQIRLRRGEKMDDYHARIYQAVNAVKMAGGKVDDERLKRHTIEGLKTDEQGRDHGYIAFIQGSYANPNLSMTQLKVQLGKLAKDGNRKESSRGQDRALAASEDRYQGGKTAGKSRKGNRDAKGPYGKDNGGKSKSGKQKDKVKRNCSWCKEMVFHVELMPVNKHGDF